MKQELKPCPFCGDPARYSKSSHYEFVACGKCHCSVQSELDCDFELQDIPAPVVWNTRAPDARVQLLAKALEEFVNAFNQSKYHGWDWQRADKARKVAIEALAEAGIK